jgi:hypothetical protein
MSLHLQKFIERMRGHDARGAKDFIMPMNDAKGMAADLTELLLELRTLKEQAIIHQQDEVIEVNINGGSFK